MITASEAAEEYRAELANLTRNDKIQINLLTILAQDYASFSKEIVKVIQDTLHTFPVSLKIVILYVIDSIIKNNPVCGGYRDLFAKDIENMVLHVFKESNEETRASIYRLRCTWSGLFPNFRLYKLDVNLNAIDKAWPIQSPKDSKTAVETPAPVVPSLAAGGQAGRVVHVNPRFLNARPETTTTSQQQKSKQQQPHTVAGPSKAKSSMKKEPTDEANAVTTTTPELDSTLVITINTSIDEKPSAMKPEAKKEKSREETEKVVTTKKVSKDKEEKKKPILKEVKKEKVEINKDVKRRTDTPVEDKAVNKEKKPDTSRSSSAHRKLFEHEKEKQKKSISKVDQEQIKQTEKRRPIGKEPVLKKARMDFGRIPKKTLTTASSSKAKVGQAQTKIPKMTRPESLLTLKVNLPPTAIVSPASTQQQPQQAIPFSAQTKRPRRISVTHQPHQQIQQHQHHGFPHQNTNVRLSEPTASLGAHAFGHDVLAAVASASSAIGASTPPSNELEKTTNAMEIVDISQQQQFQFQIQEQLQRELAPPVESAAQQQSVVPPSTFELPQQQQTFTNPIAQMPMEQPAPVVIPQHNIQNLTVRLPGVQENNRIFVDGQAYEVFYLEEVAVIERNGLPHRVSFAGPPRDVIIDGVVYRIAFGEQKHVLIDGDLHVLRFGAPSRELYMGNFPFKGAFGGSPIVATINGRRHEIRLCGPPPEVRIDPEPSYELMRYMPAIRQQQHMHQQQERRKVEAKTEPALDVSSLLKRLKNSGILTQLTEPERKTRERQAAIEAKSATVGRSNSPPIPCNHRFDHIKRQEAPIASLDQFSLRALTIHYDSVIDAIHQQRKTCQHCGIAFKELYGEAHQRHADWHLSQTLNMKDPRHKYARSQPWYMPEEWFNYSETELVNKVQNSDVAVDKASGGERNHETNEPIGQTQVKDGTQNPQSDSVDNKVCEVCHEHFAEYWDEDEEVWRLRDCVLSDGKAFHTYCREDATNEAFDASEMAHDDEGCDLDMRHGTMTNDDTKQQPNKLDGETENNEQQPQMHLMEDDDHVDANEAENKLSKEFYENDINKKDAGGLGD